MNTRTKATPCFQPGSSKGDHLLSIYERPDLVISHGLGCRVWDTDGREYLDFVSGIGVNALGHSHPTIVSAIQDQVERLLHVSNRFHHPYQRLLAERLSAWSGLDRVFLSNSGAEGVEAALKVARLFGRSSFPQRWRFVALENSFHGRTCGALAVTGNSWYRQPFEPLAPGVDFVERNNIEALRKAVTNETAAVITETIQGEGGVHLLTSEFIREVRAVTQTTGALWIADETQCGLGRTGDRFAYQQHEVELPDVVVTAKPLASGIPLGATLFSERVAEAVHPGAHGTTFGGGPLACRVALETLEIIESLLPHIRDAGAYLFDRLDDLAARHGVIVEVRGRGLMVGIELATPGDPLVEKCLERGLVVNCTHERVIRLLPPYIVTETEIDRAITVLDATLS